MRPFAQQNSYGGESTTSTSKSEDSDGLGTSSSCPADFAWHELNIGRKLPPQTTASSTHDYRLHFVTKHDLAEESLTIHALAYPYATPQKVLQR